MNFSKRWHTVSTDHLPFRSISHCPGARIIARGTGMCSSLGHVTLCWRYFGWFWSPEIPIIKSWHIHVLMCINRYVRGLAHTSDPNRSYISWMPNRLSHHHVRQARAAAGEAAKKVPQHFTGSSWWVHRWHFAQQLLLTEMWFDFWCRWNEMYCTLEECYL